MYYAIISEDVADSLPLRATARPAHIDRLEGLKQQGRLLAAGPCPVADTEDISAGVSGIQHAGDNGTTRAIAKHDAAYFNTHERGFRRNAGGYEAIAGHCGGYMRTVKPNVGNWVRSREEEIHDIIVVNFIRVADQ